MSAQSSSANDKVRFWTMIDWICSGRSGTRVEDRKKYAKFESLREQHADIVKKHHSISIPEIVKATKRLIFFSSTQLSRRLEFQAQLHDIKFNYACDAIYNLCSLRGFKNVVRSFPHAVEDLEAVYATLISLDKSHKSELWRTQYSLLVWLGVLMMNPFDIDLVVVGDSGLFIFDIVKSCYEALSCAGPPREAAAFCLSKALTRQDVSILHFHNLVRQTADSIVEISESACNGPLVVLGAMTTLAEIYKHADRTWLQNISEKVFKAIRPCFGSDACATHRSLKQLAIKLTARIGFAVLRPIPYQCHSRVRRTLMALNTRISEGHVEGNEENPEGRIGASIGLEVGGLGKLVELVLDTLLKGIRDSDTKTRWSSAKGIGRIASRLSQGLADDIVKDLLAVFDDPGSIDKDNAWHGSCLALAELTRLRILLPVRLPGVLSALAAAISFDRRRGINYVGAHVRDAACYVAWAFARAYASYIHTHHIALFVERILLTAVYDREVHVRRAAGAALQEIVGRRGVLVIGAIGIEMTQIINFFALGSRERAYVGVTMSIAKLGYWEPMFNHLLQVRCRHWDSNIRLLAAKSLRVLISNVEDQATRNDIAHRAMVILAPLASASKDLASRHGALLALSQITYALEIIDDNLASEVSAVVPKLEAARLYRGKGGDLVRTAACRLIEALSSCYCPLSVKAQLNLLDSLDRSSCHPMETVRIAAVGGMRALTRGCFGGSQGCYDVVVRPSERLLARTTFKYINLVRTPANADVSRGICQCLGVQPKRLLTTGESTLDAVLDILVARAYLADRIAGEKDAETRRDALVALKEIVMSITSTGLMRPRVLKLWIAFVQSAACDFGVDKRGDVGSWSRIQGLEAAVILSAVHTRQNDFSVSSKSVLVPAFIERATAANVRSFTIAKPFLGIDSTFNWGPIESEGVCSALFRHLGEKLDTTRKISLKLVPQFLQHAPAIPMRYRIKDMVSKDCEIDLPIQLCACLRLQGVYQDAIISGIIHSAGSYDLQVSNKFRLALMEYAHTIQGYPDSYSFAKTLITKVHPLVACVPLGTSMAIKLPGIEELNRDYLPLLRCLTALLDDGAFLPIFQGPFFKYSYDELSCNFVEVLSRLAASRKVTKSVTKTCAVADTLLAVLRAAAVTASQIATVSLIALLRCLISPYPRIRVYVAEQMYARLIELSVLDDCFLDTGQLLDAQTLLVCSPWHSEDCQGLIMGHVSRLALILKIQQAQIQLRPASASVIMRRDELDSYSNLIKEAGY